MSPSKKFLLVLPLIVIPFLIVLFMILGGGGGDSGIVKQAASGLNVKLPDAHFKKGADKNKFLLYEEAGKDSAILKEKIRKDPGYSSSTADDKTKMDENEKKVMAKLEMLKSVIRQDEKEKPVAAERNWQPNLKARPGFDRPDPINPQVKQISEMLDKVMAIQHPEMLRDSMLRLDDKIKAQTFAVRVDEPVSGVTEQVMINRFYDLAEDESIESRLDNSIEAIVPEDQVLVSGGTIKLELMNDVRINGRLIMKNQLIYGVAALNGDRLKVQFSSVRSGNNILPVALEAFDMDGLAGIYIPGSINRDVAKQSGDQAIGSIGLNSFDPSLSAQAAGAGIQAAKTLISRKAKLVRVTIKAGYKLLLKDVHS